MNLQIIIQDILDSINSDAELFSLLQPRFESKTSDFNKTMINIIPEFTINQRRTRSGELIDNYTYEIDFLTPNEWDASSNVNHAKIDEMKILASSVFWQLVQTQNLPNSDNITINYTSKIIGTQNTMTGVRATIVIPYRGQIVCNYNS
jgi:hypothetical protein